MKKTDIRNANVAGAAVSMEEGLPGTTQRTAEQELLARKKQAGAKRTDDRAAVQEQISDEVVLDNLGYEEGNGAFSTMAHIEASQSVEPLLYAQASTGTLSDAPVGGVSKPIFAIPETGVAATTSGATGVVAGLSSLEIAGIALGGAALIGGTVAIARSGDDNQTISALSDAQVAALTPAQVGGLTAAQVGALTDAQLAALTPAQVGALTATQIDALTPAQVAALGTDVASLSAAALASLDAAQIGALTDAQVAALTPAQVASLSDAQVAGFTATNADALTAAQLDALAAAGHLDGLSDAAVAAVPAATLGAVAPATVGALTDAQLAALTPVQVGALTATQIDVLTPAQIAALGTDITGLSTSALDSIDVAQAGGITQSQYFDLWNAENSAPLGGGDSRLQHLSAEMSQVHATTSADGTASGTNALSQYVNQVTGTDIVSDAEFDAGFTITGHAAAGASGTIKFYLDNDRTDGVNQVGTQLVEGADGVHINYNNSTGDYTLTFDANSAALLQATHNTYGSGIHQLTVDTDGSGAKNGSEASRLFLVADGTASSSDTGTVAQNYSVQDKVTGDAFVYYYGDPDGTGVGLWTKLDNGDTAANTGLVTTNRDADTNGWGDWDYYNTTGVALGTASTVANTALGMTTQVTAQTWEFHMGKSYDAAGDGYGAGDYMNQSGATANAGDHAIWNSNTSRLASEGELLALYAANFGAGNTVGAVQPITDTSSYNGYVASEDNRPGGWAGNGWSSAPTPSGHAYVTLGDGHANDSPDGTLHYVSAVL